MKNSFLKKIEHILPSYAYVPVALVVIANVLAYYLTKALMADATHYNLSIFIDDWMPMTPWFISFYILAYVQWFEHYIFHSRFSKELCYHFATAGIIAKLICLVCFIVMPTSIVRPEIAGDGFWWWLVDIIYSTDTPVNLFPSIHVLESYIAFRAAASIKSLPKWYVIFQFIFTIFVCLSIVYVKQHYFVDILGGIAVVEIGWFISKRFRVWRIFEKIEFPYVRRKYPKIDNT